MRLIDADVLIKQCKPRGIADEVWKESNEYKQIINAPTIDAVEVVRCKDCEYAVGPSFEGYLHCDVFWMLRDETGYCSCGERREDGEDK